MSDIEKFISYIKKDTESIKEAQTRREPIKNFSGKIIAYIVYRDNGDQELTEFTGKVLGRYVSKSNMTHDFYGKILGQGNILTSLLR
jgi:hypothetical protein